MSNDPIPGLDIRFSVFIDTSGAVIPFGMRKKNRPMRCGKCGEQGHRSTHCKAE